MTETSDYSLNDIFAKSGLLNQIHPEFDFRQSQHDMSITIHNILDKKKNGIIEAGTGVGKSLAYLVPALLFSIENEKTIAVSTETKALQNQLLFKDFPLAKELVFQLTGKNAKASLCLGSANYPCRKKFISATGKASSIKGWEDYVQEINEHFDSKKILTKFDFNVPSYIWNEISRDSESCNNFQCPFNNKCIFQRAKKEWQDANLLIMNHHLFYSNIISGRTYLPEFSVVIFDEAHSLEGIASDQFGFSHSQNELTELTDELYQRKKKSAPINRIEQPKLKLQLINELVLLRKELDSLYANLRELLTPEQRQQIIKDRLNFSISFIDQFDKLLMTFDTVVTNSPDEIIEELNPLLNRLTKIKENFKQALNMQDADFVYWLEKTDNNLIPDIALCGQPIEVAKILSKEVSDYYDSSIYVSATLAINNNFNSLAGTLGITHYEGKILPSPFKYREQVLLYLPKNIDQADSQNYYRQIAMETAEIANLTDGKNLILFTSYKALSEVKKLLPQYTDRPLFAQGDYAPHKALEKYRKCENGLLLGTDSFWQGIDLPGNELKGVIITRLPFAVPDHPLMQARVAKIEKSGQNPFMVLQIPQAVIKFKQGFGRLIRTSSDYGIVAVLDSRIVTKFYGQLFIKALPVCQQALTMNELKGKAKLIGL